MRGALLLGAVMFAAVLLPAGSAAADTSTTYYFHPDGTLTGTPGQGVASANVLYCTAPAAAAYVLRAGSVVYVESAGILAGAIRTTLTLDGVPLATGSGGGALLPLGGHETGISLDNPETLLHTGDVLALSFDAAPGLLASTTPLRLVVTTASVPSPVAPSAPATPATVPVPTPASTSTPSAGATPASGSTPGQSGSSAGAGATTTGGSTGGSPSGQGSGPGAPGTAPNSPGAPSAAAGGASLAMPWESATGVLLLILLATSLMGGWSLVRLGRI